MKTTRYLDGIAYWKENGKYTIDGYEFFNTLAGLKLHIYWSKLWIEGKAYRNENGDWVLC